MDRPFIHLIHTPNGKYFFDVNRNEIVSVSEKGYEYLQTLIEQQNIINPENSKISPEIEHLLAHGYLSSNKVKEILYPIPEIIELLNERKIRKITLQVTQDCNLYCKYCIYSDGKDIRQRTHSKRNMDISVARKAVNFLVEHAVDSESVNIGFYGGEPLLEYELIKNTILYSESKFQGKKVTFSLTSNGTLLTDNIVEFFIEHNVSLVISLDGPKEIHNINRVFAKNGSGTYDVIEKNILHIKKKYPEYAKCIRINMVVDPKNDFDCINSFEMDLLGLENINFSASMVDSEFLNEKREMTDFYYKKAQYGDFLAILNYLGLIDEKLVAPTLLYGITHVLNTAELIQPTNILPDTAIPGGPCVPGQSRLFVTVDGKFLPCERVAELSSVMQIGSLDSGFDFEKIQALINVGSLTPKECQNCWAFRFCSLCGKCADAGDRLDGKKKLSHCKESLGNAHDVLRKMILLKEIPIFYKEELEKGQKYEQK